MASSWDFSFEIEEVLKNIGTDDTMLVLGGTDTGKTTLIKRLHERLGGKVIDGDLGQPEIGPPGLLSRGSYGNGMENGYFVGGFTPRGNLVQVMTGIARLIRTGARPLFVDTDGWIDGDAALVYKGELISLIDPDVLLLLERNSELEKFSTFLSPEKTISLSALTGAKKSRGERAANRIRKLKYYFSRASRVRRSWSEVSVAGTLLGKGEEVSREQLAKAVSTGPVTAWKFGTTLTVVSRSKPDLEGKLKRELDVARVIHHPTRELRYRLAGCHRDGEFAGLGTLTEISPEGPELLTPCEKFNILKLGEERVKPSGRSVA